MNQVNIPGFHRYIRLEQLISNCGNKYAQNLIKDQFRKLRGTRWQNESEEVKLFLKEDCSKFYRSLKNEDQKKVVDNGDLTQFDLTLSNTLLRSIPAFANSDRGKLLKQLVEVRNAVKHFADLNVNHDLFESYWKLSAEALVEFGMPSDEIENIKSTIHLNSHVLTETEFNPRNSRTGRKLRKKGKRLVKRKAFQEAIHMYTTGLALAGLRSKERSFLLSNRSQARIFILKNKTLPEDEITLNIDSAYKDAQNLISSDPTWWVGYHLIGQMHQFKKEYQQAINWFDRALERNPNAKEAKLFKNVCKLGLSHEKSKDYSNPLGLPSSLNEKAEKFRKQRGFGPSGKFLIDAMNEGLRSGDPTRRANVSLVKARLHQIGEDLPLDHKAAFKIYLDLAEQGVIEAYVYLGIIYLFPDEKGVEPDVEKGVHWIEKSANAGVAHGIFCLGRLYEDGVGKPQNFCKALELYLQASEKGHGGASHNLGIFYLDGIGCCEDEERAKQYFTQAAIREIPYAMDHLAWMYVQEGNVDLSLVWYKQAIKYDNVHSILEEKKFKEAVRVEQCRTKIAQILEQYHIYVGNKSVRQVLTELLAKHETANETKIVLYPQIATRMRIDEDNFYRGTIWEHRMEILERSRQGLPYANLLLNAMDLFQQGCAMMINYPYCAIGFFADCIRKSEVVPDLTEAMQEQLEILCGMIPIDNMVTPNYLDLRIRICSVQLLASRNDAPRLFPYLEDCIRHYPEEKFFIEALGFTLAFTGRYVESFETFVSALEKFPFDPTLLYGKMAVMKHLVGIKVSVDDVLETCKLFIQKAHRDDRMIPEAYFIMAFMEIFHKNNNAEGEKIYEDGLKAEINLISYFLPYVSYVKEVVEKRINEILGGIGNTEHLISDPNEDTRRYSQATSPIRFEITTQHRKGYKEFYDRIFSSNRLFSQPGWFSRLSVLPMQQQQHKQYNLNGLKEITIREMNPHGDKIHEGRVLHAQIAETSWNVAGKWYSVVKDKHHDCIHITIEDFPEAKTKLWIGSKLSIKNPYYRLAFAKEMYAIRVDDINTIEFGERVNICKFCWAEDAEIFCGYCMTTYCDEECQKKDIKLLKNPILCDECDITFDVSDWESTESEDSDSEYSESD